MTNPRTRTALSRFVSVACTTGCLGFMTSIFVPDITQTAIANGDTRTLSFVHAHRKDSLTVTFRVNGRYDAAALEKLNYFLRDWRNDAQIKMDPRLFDVIWEARRSAGSDQPVLVLSSYRSPNTNAMLRRRSRQVANNSQHMYGRAMDIRFPGMNMHRVREIAVKMQRGGVGWYNGSNFVHLDVGSVRTWPRMSYDQLARLFPNGETVHIAADGRTLPGYEQARAMVASRSGTYVPTLAQTREKSFLARLFGFDDGDEADQNQARASRVAADAPRRGARPVAAAEAPVSPPSASEDNGPAAFFRADARRNESVQVAAAPAPAPAVTAAEPKTDLRVQAQSAGRSQPDAPATAVVAAASAQPIRLAMAPLPPRRPSQASIEATITQAAAAGHVPLPPARPSELIAVAEAHTATSPSPREQVAALIGANAPGAIARSGVLPEMITRGTPVAAHAGAVPLAYAPQVQPAKSRVRKITPRRATSGLPSLSRAVALRRSAHDNGLLVAARLDRSNFTSLTAPRRIAESQPSSAMGSAVAPLRAAARHDPAKLLFAPADAAASGFTHAANVWRADRFGPVAQQQADARSAQKGTLN